MDSVSSSTINNSLEEQRKNINGEDYVQISLPKVSHMQNETGIADSFACPLYQSKDLAACKHRSACISTRASPKVERAGGANHRRHGSGFTNFVRERRVCCRHARFQRNFDNCTRTRYRNRGREISLSISGFPSAPASCLLCTPTSGFLTFSIPSRCTPDLVYFAIPTTKLSVNDGFPPR